MPAVTEWLRRLMTVAGECLGQLNTKRAKVNWRQKKSVDGPQWTVNVLGPSKDAADSKKLAGRTGVERIGLRIDAECIILLMQARW